MANRECVAVSGAAEVVLTEPSSVEGSLESHPSQQFSPPRTRCVVGQRGGWREKGLGVLLGREVAGCS